MRELNAHEIKGVSGGDAPPSPYDTEDPRWSQWYGTQQLRERNMTSSELAWYNAGLSYGGDIDDSSTTLTGEEALDFIDNLNNADAAYDSISTTTVTTIEVEVEVEGHMTYCLETIFGCIDLGQTPEGVFNFPE